MEEKLMKYFISKNENARETLLELLVNDGEWLICCTAENPEDFNTYIFENVTRLENEGELSDEFNAPVFIEYGISPMNSGEFPYRIHDSIVVPITDVNLMESIVSSMLKTFDAFVIEEDLVDRKTVWGKLGTDHAEEIVFEYKGC